MKRLFVLTVMILPMAGCAQIVSRATTPFTPKPDVVVGAGYRASDDQCRRVGASSITEPYITAEEDLVGCPIDFDGRPEFAIKTGGREVTRTEDWVIYRVPLVGEAPTTDG